MKTINNEVLYNMVQYLAQVSRQALRDSQVALQLLVNNEDKDIVNANLAKVEQIRKLVERNSNSIKELDNLFGTIEKKHDYEENIKELYYKSIKDPSSVSDEDKEKIYQAIKDGLITIDDMKKYM